jgi:hypothetical protein
VNRGTFEATLADVTEVRVHMRRSTAAGTASAMDNFTLRIIPCVEFWTSSTSSQRSSPDAD